MTPNLTRPDGTSSPTSRSQQNGSASLRAIVSRFTNREKTRSNGPGSSLEFRGIAVAFRAPKLTPVAFASHSLQHDGALQVKGNCYLHHGSVNEKHRAALVVNCSSYQIRSTAVVAGNMRPVIGAQKHNATKPDNQLLGTASNSRTQGCSI